MLCSRVYRGYSDADMNTLETPHILSAEDHPQTRRLPKHLVSFCDVAFAFGVVPSGAIPCRLSPYTGQRLWSAEETRTVVRSEIWRSVNRVEPNN